MNLLFTDFSGLPDNNVKTEPYRNNHSELKENQKMKQNPTFFSKAGFYIEALRSKPYPTANRVE
jgi:hypothetical protein